jgi:hypothetical protein
MKSPAKRRVGRFSTGNEKRPGAPAMLRVGSFADGYAATQRSGTTEAPLSASTGHTGSPAPIDAAARLTHAGATADKPLARYAAHLRTIATTLEEETSDGASVEIAMLSLAYVEHALRDLSHAIDHAGDMLIPLGDGEKSLPSRLAPAAGSTPRVARTLAPPRERQAQLLASLREASAALRAAAECCHRTRNIVGSPAA